MNAGEELGRFAEEQYGQEVITINDRILCVKGMGHSNAIVIEGRTSAILVDSLDSDARGARLRALVAERVGKPVKTIIFTHSHNDHTGGSGAFRADRPEVIAHAPARKPLSHYDRIAGVLKKRTFRQFGHGLSSDELIAQGLGPREGHACGDGVYDVLPVTTLLEGRSCEREIDGVPMSIVSAPGETDDTVFIWLPEDRVLCCGDNWYPCFPNLYAIRGSQYRDIASWIRSLDEIIDMNADVLLPGHMTPLFGREHIRSVLSSWRGAIASVLDQTLACIEKGMSMQQCADAVRLPEEFRGLPWLKEFYGTVEWSVKGIYAGYLGWFDGNPANLCPVSEPEWAGELVDLIGPDKALQRVRELYAQGEWQKGLQLCDLLARAGKPQDALMRAGLLARAEQLASANGRHYCQSVAHELEQAQEEGGADGK